MTPNNIIIKDHKIILFLPAKCANTSIKKALGYDKDWYLRNKITACEAKKYTDYKKYIFVRNPYQRLVSCYRNKARKDRKYMGFAKNGFPKDGSFAEFVRFVVNTPPEVQDVHARPYYVDSYCQYKRVPDIAIHVKDLSKRWKEIQSIIGCADINHENSSGVYNLEQYYTPELKELVYQYYKKDFEDYYA